MRVRKSNPRRILYSIFVISILSSGGKRSSPTYFPVANGLNSSIKRNAKGQPRLCSVMEVSLNGFTRLCFGKATQKDITIQALSNRKVLQGKLESLQVSMKKSKSSLIALDSVTITGNDLNFGYLPLVIAASLPTLFFLLSVREIFYLALFVFLWRNQRQNLLRPERIKAIETRMERQRQKVSKFLLGEGPCRLNYQITMTNDSLKDSAWVQVLAKSLVQTFMANSALPLAAAVSDVTNNLMLLEDSSSPPSSPSNLRNAGASGGSLSTNNPKDNPILTLWKEQEEAQNDQRRRNQQQQQQQKQEAASTASPSFPLTDLFAATSFELRQAPVFAKDGHIWLPCVANLPYASNNNNNNNNNNKSQLDFTLRTKPKVASTFPQQQQQQKQQGLEFSAAECSLDVKATQTPEWAKQFLPSIVWLPIGAAGMILPIGGFNKHQLKRVTVQDDACQIQGELDLFRKKSSDGSSFMGEGRIIGKTFGNLLQSFSSRKRREKGNDTDDRPKLPGGK
ncbi:unnamed protein product [Cylindrotheca closterium]|uniref:Uncharacterized protein n=1 Tax=Cylindrotheca closterium TaxID=2856 RepID=A0AAD2CHB4_9STRA|nr:unnamed protein product [Cylindrotheca closterium]